LEAFTDPQKFFESAIAGGLGNMDVMQKMFSAMAAGSASPGKRES